MLFADRRFFQTVPVKSRDCVIWTIANSGAHVRELSGRHTRLSTAAGVVMHAFSLGYRSWCITRALGRNPLLRWTDRIEASVFVFPILAALPPPPVCPPPAARLYRSPPR